MPPYSSAAALRGASVVAGLAHVLGNDTANDIEVHTTTLQPTPLPGVNMVVLGGSDVENSAGLVVRTLGELQMGWSAARSLLAGSRPRDLLVVSTPSYLAALVICARARARRVPYVLDLRDIYPQAYAASGLIRPDGCLYRFFDARSRAMYRGALRVITATQSLAREVRRAAPGIDAECIYNGFPSSLGWRSTTKHQRFTVCFHGVLGFFQDIETLIDVARRLGAHDIDVVAIGYGRKEVLLRSCRVANLRFLGRLSFEQTIAEVEQCHVGLCLRSEDEVSKDAFPVKVWEYLGLGMPCVVTPPCEAGAFLEQHGCGFQAPAGQVDTIVRRILRLKHQPLELEGMSQRCRSAGANFTREALGIQAAELIAAAAGSRSE